MPNKDEHMFTLVGNQVSAIDNSNTISITHPAIWRNYKVWTNIGRMWSNWNSLIMPICNCKNYIVKRMGGICLVKQKTNMTCNSTVPCLGIYFTRMEAYS